MKFFISSFLACTALLLTVILLSFPAASRSIQMNTVTSETAVSFMTQAGSEGAPKDGFSSMKEGVGLERFPITGSSLPDCSHACGPCFPCRRVMVSFSECSFSESCHIVYRCRCRGRFYHVPSN